MSRQPRRTSLLEAFAGSGTVGLVADRLGRDATLIDLNTSYIDMAVDRIVDDAPLFAKVDMVVNRIRDAPLSAKVAAE